MEEAHSKEEEQQDVTSVQYFTAANLRTIRHRWLVLFYEFMTRPTAGDKKRTIRLQHASQMHILLEAIDPQGDDILCLLDDEGDAVWKLWVKPHLKKGTKKPGTIISYLTSYEKFLQFVTHERFNKTAPPVHPDYMARFATLQKDIKGWRSTVDSQSHHVKNKRMVSETEGLLTLQELAQIKASDAYQNAHKLIIEAGRGKNLSLKEFVNVRDFLICKFSLDTGTRPGPLNNATLEEYFVGKAEDGCKVMLVARHKRAKDGPAICPMLPDMYKFMEIYVCKIRPTFAQPDEEHLFIKKDGSAYLAGTVGKRYSRFIERCGIKLGSRMAFVDMRKLITTKMLERCSPQEQAILRRILAHSEKTSKQWYARPDLTSTGIKAVNIIQKLLDMEEKESKESKEEEEEADAATSKAQKDTPAVSFQPDAKRSAEPPVSGPGEPEEFEDQSIPPPKMRVTKEVGLPKHPKTAKTAQISAASTSASNTKGAAAATNYETHSLPSKKSSKRSTLVSGVAPATPPRQTLSEKQKDKIRSTFAKEIEAGTKVTMNEVQRTLRSVPKLCILSYSKNRVKQVVNFVNYVAKTQPAEAALPKIQQTTEAKVTSWLDDFDDPSTRSKASRRNEWDPEDTALLMEAFQDFSELPHTTQIRAIISRDVRLQRLLEESKWDRFYNKLKNIFRKAKK